MPKAGGRKKVAAVAAVEAEAAPAHPPCVVEDAVPEEGSERAQGDAATASVAPEALPGGEEAAEAGPAKCMGALEEEVHGSQRTAATGGAATPVPPSAPVRRRAVGPGACTPSGAEGRPDGLSPAPNPSASRSLPLAARAAAGVGAHDHPGRVAFGASFSALSAAGRDHG